MSPRASSSSSASTARAASAPYPRRSMAQPKSTRQQFSACGACRMRRVRCDLKDLPIPSVGPHPTCSNCKERGIKCVDEFADVKAVKLLRRGRRLQQVEAIYGKSSDPETSSIFPYSTRLPNSIPALQPDFFSSPFWRWFNIQRPILDAAEFSSRFLSHQKGERSLGPEAGIVTMLLVVWAFSFGLNEYGHPVDEDASSAEASPPPPTEPSPSLGQDDSATANANGGLSFTNQRQQKRDRTDRMLQQILELVDLHGILRRPSLDGVRVLLLLLPLLEDAKPLERLAIHNTALSQIQALCTLSIPSPSSSSSHPFEDATARARLFWYAYTQEGLLTGLRGGRFVLRSDDYEAFQRTLSLHSYNASHAGLPSPPSPTSLTSAPPSLALQYAPQADSAYNRLVNSSSLPLQLNTVCRRIHAVLTGPKAARRAEEHNLIDALGMREIWRDLDQCWREFTTIRRNAAANDDPASRCDTERYACAWQIFIFECHNVIRESLKQYMAASPGASTYPAGPSSRPSSHSSASSPYLSPQHLHAVATRKCLGLLPNVIRIVEYCLAHSHESDRSGAFIWDSGLVRDGCFFAGYLAASTDEDILDSPSDAHQTGKVENEGTLPHLTADKAVLVCLSALGSMRWSCSKSDEREETIRMVWERRKARRHGQTGRYPDMTYDATYPHANGQPIAQLQTTFQPTNPALLPATSYLDRTMLPCVNVYSQAGRVGSAPATACTTDGQGTHGWPSYTPPPTANSLTATSSTGASLSVRGSPEFAHVMPPFNPQPEEHYYHSSGDLDHFTYNVPGSTPHPSEMASAINDFSHRHSPIDAHSLAQGSHPNDYLHHAASPGHFASAPGPMLSSGNEFNYMSSVRG